FFCFVVLVLVGFCLCLCWFCGLVWVVFWWFGCVWFFCFWGFCFWCVWFCGVLVGGFGFVLWGVGFCGWGWQLGVCVVVCGCALVRRGGVVGVVGLLVVLLVVVGFRVFFLILFYRRVGGLVLVFGLARVVWFL
ncbi:hypothetical protein RA264_27820, partial [Pseudomonas syringae pv. tagetis]|uniref:hypothetical protein n=1 Tax=Pseudomonas syringae group genomosp. 7 TaxID=251699 RepID=UPI0037707188